MPPDTSALVRSVRDSLAAQGYGLVQVDSVAASDSIEGDTAVVFVKRGPLLQVESVALLGVDSARADRMRELLDTRPGRPLRPATLDADAQRIVRALSAEGFALAQVQIAELDVRRDSLVHVALAIDLGRELRLDSLTVRGADVRPIVARSLTGLRVGEPLVGYDPARVRQRLEASGLFASVDSLRLRVRDGTQAALVVDVTPAAPGAFDLVLGVVPEAGGGASLVGSGFLSLLSPFGFGHRYQVRLDRQPGRTSRAEALAELPYLPFVPIGLVLGFEGLQQDSTLSTQRLRGEVTYGSPAWQVFASASRETTNPGIGGARVVGGRQQVARSQVTFVGGGLRADRRDRPISPRRGVLAEVRIERGTRLRSFGVAEVGETVRRREEGAQDRATARLRLFAQPLPRVVAVTGGEGFLLRSDAYEVGELFRIGGTRTLRGYPDDRFFARQGARALGEVRLLLDRTSYLYLFADVAWLDQPRTSDAAVRAQSGFFPGYGGGIQFETPLGLINASYAASPETGMADGQVHVGLSFGL
jgi:outer membrane protein assembly factor BamA